jgi:hypothetical protein
MLYSHMNADHISRFFAPNPPRINTSEKSNFNRFIINTSKTPRILLILKDFKSTRINTSEISRRNPSRINTSKKRGRGEGSTHFPRIPSTDLLFANQRTQHKEKFGGQACKPDSVPRAAPQRAAHCGDHSSRPAFAHGLQQPTRGSRQHAPKNAPLAGRAGPPLLFGLAPRGVCRAVPISRDAVGSYPTVSPLPCASSIFDSDRRKVLPPGHHRNAAPAVYFLWHFPSPCRPGAHRAPACCGPAPWRYQARCPLVRTFQPETTVSGLSSRSISCEIDPAIARPARRADYTATFTAAPWRLTPRALLDHDLSAAPTPAPRAPKQPARTAEQTEARPYNAQTR